ncbi:SDR family oxidoreductase [Streptomyces sp. NPDC006175]|uniref:SDR family oxidoreductase n=1 Tax=Streptomyces sp. NPDC006175 TaxID=3154471 RepID=UPI0033BB68B1
MSLGIAGWCGEGAADAGARTPAAGHEGRHCVRLAGRYGTSEEMAAAAVHLSSGEARYVTGQQIVLDGGVSVRGPFPE